MAGSTIRFRSFYHTTSKPFVWPLVHWDNSSILSTTIDIILLSIVATVGHVPEIYCDGVTVDYHCTDTHFAQTENVRATDRLVRHVVL